MLLDAWRLALGTLTSIPARPPLLVDARRAGTAMVLAPLATLPLGAALCAVALAGHALRLDPLPVALLALGAAVVGNRGFHLDGLSDTVDGLAASHDRERSLQVMRTGTSGPAGTVALVLVLGLQVTGLAGLLSSPHWFRCAVLAGAALCLSRVALALGCTRGLPPARPDGLARSFTETVHPAVTALMWLLAALVLAVLARWAGLPWWRGALALALAAAACGLLLAHSGRRLGGVTGDVLGAAVELSFATVLVALS